MGDQIKYTSNDPLNINQLAKETFELKEGDCEDHAMFGLYCLIKNEYDYDNFDKYSTNAAVGLDVQWGPPDPVWEGKYAYGHAVCLFRENNLFFFLDSEGVIRGAFNTVEDAVNDIANRYNVYWKRYTFFDINFKITYAKKRT